MLRTYSKSITATSGTAIPFNTNKILTGNTITHLAGSSDIIINTPGYYKIDLDFTGDVPDELTEIQLFADDIAIPDALISMTLTADENISASFSTIVYAAPGPNGNTVKLNIKPNVALTTVTYIALGINRLA